MKNQVKKEMPKTLFFYGSKEVLYKGQPVNRRMTVAGVLSEDGKKAYLATAMCSEKDQFTKAKGKTIAIGRALKHPVMTVEITEDRPGRQFVEAAKHLVD